MEKLAESDVLDLETYERVRPEFRRRAMAEKAVRRIGVGPIVTVFFENRLTMHYQLQEMLRIEKISRREAVLEEMAVWNGLIPGDAELSMTLMIEEELSKAKERLEELKDLEEHVSLVFGGREVAAKFENEWRDDNRISAVQYIRFALDEPTLAAFGKADSVKLVIDHPRYRHEAVLPRESLAALRSDLGLGPEYHAPLPAPSPPAMRGGRTIYVRAPAKKVWAALTDPRRFAEWACGLALLGDLKKGGGWTWLDSRKRVVLAGEVDRVSREKELATSFARFQLATRKGVTALRVELANPELEALADRLLSSLKSWLETGEALDL